MATRGLDTTSVARARGGGRGGGQGGGAWHGWAQAGSHGIEELRGLAKHGTDVAGIATCQQSVDPMHGTGRAEALDEVGKGKSGARHAELPSRVESAATAMAEVAGNEIVAPAPPQQMC